MRVDYSSNSVAPQAADVLQVKLDPLAQEACNLLVSVTLPGKTQTQVPNSRQQLQQIKGCQHLNCHFNEAVPCSSQAEGVTRSCGFETRRESRHDAVEFISRREECAWQGPGAFIFKAEGLVVIIDGLRDFICFALGPSVETAHHSLQFREFLDHLGCQIAFREFDGTQSRSSLPRSHASL